ncbi:hypothetical protein [Marinifilum flexuosum]|uniref:Uncharacterized protein n=1 Tax=Marinifilum flexuosum TaxID=1117708 RepID=A0A419X652_9BACT|nr:hypothetical protein [Marinifilum flexuosum]RKE03218.1 hypothetical protein BXY64_0210 [Marinifilum flexuosum]
MKKISNSTFLKVHSSIYAIFAIGLFLFPKLIWPNYGVQLNDQYSTFLSQHNSIFLGGIAIIGFLFKDTETKSLTAQKLFKGLMLTNVLGVLITLYAGFTKIFVGFGWSDPIFFALLAILSFIKLKDNQ